MCATCGRPAGEAQRPEDVARLLVERGNAGDVEGMLELYEPDAVIAYPPGGVTRGRRAIRALLQAFVAHRPLLEPPSMVTIVRGDVALLVTAPESQEGARAQVLRRQPDGRWLQVIVQPGFGTFTPPVARP